MAKVGQFCPMTTYPVVTLAHFPAVFRQIGLRSPSNAWCSELAQNSGVEPLLYYSQFSQKLSES